MSLVSLIYVSQSEIANERAESEIESIVEWSKAFNATVGITGALIFTGTHFSQLLEGESDPVHDLMASIARDSRHTRVEIVSCEAISARRFPDWNMVYDGRSQFVSQHLADVLTDQSSSERERATGALTRLIKEFACAR